MKNQNTLFTTILLLVGCFALYPVARAVVPAPDGGYPGGNTAEGTSALLTLVSGTYNTAVGLLSLRSNTDGDFNTAIGAGTLLANIGDGNTGTGAGALLSNTVGASNTANGSLTLFRNTTGSNNTAVGINALYFNTTGSFNVALGYTAGFNVTSANSVICIGTDGENVDNSCYIGNIFNQTSDAGAQVFVTATHKLGTMTSSRRFKDEIKPMGSASEALFALKPVNFRYKKEINPAGTRQFGLVAEDVEKVNPDLVVRDKEGRPYSVRYDQVNAMLLNEFLQEHRKVEELEKQVERLNAWLHQLIVESEMRKSGSRVALDQ